MLSLDPSSDLAKDTTALSTMRLRPKQLTISGQIPDEIINGLRHRGCLVVPIIEWLSSGQNDNGAISPNSKFLHGIRQDIRASSTL